MGPFSKIPLARTSHASLRTHRHSIVPAPVSTRASPLLISNPSTNITRNWHGRLSRLVRTGASKNLDCHLVKPRHDACLLAHRLPASDLIHPSQPRVWHGAAFTNYEGFRRPAASSLLSRHLHTRLCRCPACLQANLLSSNLSSIVQYGGRSRTHDEPFASARFGEEQASNIIRSSESPDFAPG